MAIVVGKSDVKGLSAAVGALREWQYEGSPMQLHPGDLGWFRRFGADTAAAAARTWSRDGRILAVGLLDGPGLLRMTFAPDAMRDEELALAVVADVSDPERDVLPPGRASIEAPTRALVQEVLAERGWQGDELWTPLRRDLREPVKQPDVRIEVVGPQQVAERAAVQRAAFENSTFSEQHWHAMAAGEAYADARCLLAYDEHGAAVAMVTVWSAGEGKPGLLEPMGVHREHRGRGYGKAITEAAAAALQKLGASSALVCTPSSNVGGVATVAFVPDTDGIPVTAQGLPILGQFRESDKPILISVALGNGQFLRAKICSDIGESPRCSGGRDPVGLSIGKTSIPEPETFVLLGSGLVGSGAWRLAARSVGRRLVARVNNSSRG